ncbi:hypothetical protein D5086_031435 [Populus alba]|uniref:Uncharacterized protein n=1 Tax=Populus alba TaxID=43335 RepID=A0ACC4AIK1_POPAL
MEYGYDETDSKEAEDFLKEAQKQVLKANRKKDNKAKTIIYQGLNEATYETINFAEMSKEIWEALQQKYKDKEIKHALQSKLSLKEDIYEQGGLQQMDIPLEKKINRDEEDFSDFKEKDLRIQDPEEKVVEIPLEKDEHNKHLLLEEEDVVTIIMRKGISSIITAISLGTIALNVEGKLH